MIKVLLSRIRSRIRSRIFSRIHSRIFSRTHSRIRSRTRSSRGIINSTTPRRSRIAGFSLSCAAIISNILLFGLPGIVGLILSIVGLCQCNKRSEKGRGLAIAGIAIGAVLTLLMIFVYAGLILAFDNGWNSGPRYY